MWKNFVGRMCTSLNGDQEILPDIVFIGAGNVASHIAPAIERSGAGRIRQVYSRTFNNAQALAEKLRDAKATDDLSQILPDADIYIISIKDDSIGEIAQKLSPNNALWLHTSGSVNMEVLSALSPRYGVFYPMQTFSKNAPLEMSEVPLFIEGSSQEVEKEIESFAAKTFDKVYHADSELRRKMHIAAVFSCNFTNYMWVIADELLRKEGLTFDVMKPLMEETLRKAFANTPEQGQTGPAVRGDKNIMEKHEALLSESDREVYRLLSDRIFTHFNTVQ